MKLLRFISLNSLVFLVAFSSNAQVSRAYMLDEADTYFKAGRYYDAFFRYRECAKLPEFEASSQINQQIKNSSHALFLTQKFKDYFALQRLQPAKDNLLELVSMNPNDPNRGQLAHITLAQGAELQRLAWRQQTPAATADMLKRAMAFYFQAAKEGLMDESISAIKQCEAAIKDAKVPMDETNTLQPNIESIKQSSSPSASSTAPTVSHPRKPIEVIINPAPIKN
jgi:tetratricopeptide (TPR) repeat protein